MFEIATYTDKLSCDFQTCFQGSLKCFVHHAAQTFLRQNPSYENE